MSNPVRAEIAEARLFTIPEERLAVLLALEPCAPRGPVRTILYFGSYSTYLSRTYKQHSVRSSTGHWIYRIMQVAGVDEWDQLVGRKVLARQDGERTTAIGSISGGEWFVPADEIRQA